MNVPIQELKKMPYFCDLIYPEEEEVFPYLIQYLSYSSIIKIYSKTQIEELKIAQENYQNKIINSSDKEDNKLISWKNYLDFVAKLVPEEFKDQLRLFIALENFTKSMINEKHLYLYKGFISQFVFYADLCRDGINFFEYLYSKNICINNYFLYDGLAVMYEKIHNFSMANQSYLKGICFGRVIEKDELNKRYNKFENRMLLRIERDLESTSISNNEIDNYIHIKITESKKNFEGEKLPEIQQQSGTKNINPLIYVNLNFKIEKNKFIFIDEKIHNFPNTEKFGDIPIFIDDRKNNIKYLDGNNLRKLLNKEDEFFELGNKIYEFRCTQIVILYNTLAQYLYEKDKKYQAAIINFENEKKKEQEKMPYSWISPYRKKIVQEKNIERNAKVNSESKKIEIKEQINNTKSNVDSIMKRFKDELYSNGIHIYYKSKNFNDTFNYFSNLYIKRKKIKYNNSNAEINYNKNNNINKKADIDEDGDLIIKSGKKIMNKNCISEKCDIIGINNNQDISEENANKISNTISQINNEKDFNLFKNFQFDNNSFQQFDKKDYDIKNKKEIMPKLNDDNINKNSSKINLREPADNNIIDNIFNNILMENNTSQKNIYQDIYTPFSPCQLKKYFAAPSNNKKESIIKEETIINFSNNKDNNIINSSHSHISNKSDKFDIFKRKSSELPKKSSFDIQTYLLQFKSEDDILNQLNFLNDENNLNFPVEYKNEIVKELTNKLNEMREKTKKDKFIKEREKFQLTFNMNDYYLPKNINNANNFKKSEDINLNNNLKLNIDILKDNLNKNKKYQYIDVNQNVVENKNDELKNKLYQLNNVNNNFDSNKYSTSEFNNNQLISADEIPNIFFNEFNTQNINKQTIQFPNKICDMKINKFNKKIDNNSIKINTPDNNLFSTPNTKENVSSKIPDENEKKRNNNDENDSLDYLDKLFSC